MLEGPHADCQIDSWYVIVSAALPAVRNSPFCDGGLLNQLNEALLDTAERSAVDWTGMSPCESCHAVCTASILSDVAGLCTFTVDSEGNKESKQCLVFGSRSQWDSCESQIGNLVLTFSRELSLPQRGCITLHDGEPLYQHELLGCVVFSLQSLNPGDVLLLPVFSALTRVTAAVVLCLHVCFRSVTFRSPPPSGAVGAVLVCVGFYPEVAARILPVLTDVHKYMGQLLRGGEDTGKNPSSGYDRQVLQFVPMEDLLTRGLTEFLWTMNTEIIQQKLHYLMQL